jgi:IS30 family transposase
MAFGDQADLPKKIPFDTPTQKQLDKIVAKINNRPANF